MPPPPIATLAPKGAYYGLSPTSAQAILNYAQAVERRRQQEAAAKAETNRLRAIQKQNMADAIGGAFGQIGAAYFTGKGKKKLRDEERAQYLSDEERKRGYKEEDMAFEEINKRAAEQRKRAAKIQDTETAQENYLERQQNYYDLRTFGKPSDKVTDEERAAEQARRDNAMWNIRQRMGADKEAQGMKELDRWMINTASKDKNTIVDYTEREKAHQRAQRNQSAIWESVRDGTMNLNEAREKIFEEYRQAELTPASIKYMSEKERNKRDYDPRSIYEKSMSFVGSDGFAYSTDAKGNTARVYSAKDQFDDFMKMYESMLGDPGLTGSHDPEHMKEIWTFAEERHQSWMQAQGVWSPSGTFGGQLQVPGSPQAPQRMGHIPAQSPPGTAPWLRSKGAIGPIGGNGAGRPPAPPTPPAPPRTQLPAPTPEQQKAREALLDATGRHGPIRPIAEMTVDERRELEKTMSAIKTRRDSISTPQEIRREIPPENRNDEAMAIINETGWTQPTLWRKGMKPKRGQIVTIGGKYFVSDGEGLIPLEDYRERKAPPRRRSGSTAIAE